MPKNNRKSLDLDQCAVQVAVVGDQVVVNSGRQRVKAALESVSAPVKREEQRQKANVRGWKHPTLSFCSLSLGEAREAYPHVSKWRRVWLGESVLVRRGREVVREWSIVERRKRRPSQKLKARVALDDQIALFELRLAEARDAVEELKRRDIGGDWSYAGSLSVVNATMAQVIDMLPRQR